METAKLNVNTKKTATVKTINLPEEKKINDDQLIKLALSGDYTAYEMLISKYERKVHSLAIRITKDPILAEDVLQDVFMTVFRKLDSFKGNSQFSSWLYRIAANFCFMALRKRNNVQFDSIENALPTLHSQISVEVQSNVQTADQHLSTKELRSELEKAISRLDEDYRVVFIMRDVDGLSIKEICDILNLSEPAVKSRIHRARLMLQKKLSKTYYEYTGNSYQVAA